MTVQAWICPRCYDDHSGRPCKPQDLLSAMRARTERASEGPWDRTHELARLLNAVEAVLALHRPSANKDPECCVVCKDSDGWPDVYPCETVQAITEALGRS